MGVWLSFSTESSCGVRSRLWLCPPTTALAFALTLCTATIFRSQNRSFQEFMRAGGSFRSRQVLSQWSVLHPIHTILREPRRGKINNCSDNNDNDNDSNNNKSEITLRRSSLFCKDPNEFNVVTSDTR